MTSLSALHAAKRPSTLRSPRIALFAILATAAILRLGWPAITEFKADEARMLIAAFDMAELKTFPLRGLGSSVGFPNFPMSVWLYALPLFVWKHPYSATLFVAALNTVAVWACYHLTRRYWGETAALVAALFFAVSPWAVIYSRKIWAQDLLPLFVLVYIGSALAAFADRRRWFLLLHIVALAVVVQIHFSGIAFVPLTVILMIVFWRRTREAWKEIVLGVGAAALTAAPFGIWILQNADAGSGLVSNFLARPGVADTESVRFAWMVLTGGDIHSLAGRNAFEAYLALVPDMTLIRWLWGLLAIAGLIVAARRRQPADIILALWLVMPVLFFARHSTPIFPHYFIITLPAGCMLAGLAINKGSESLRSLRLRGVIFGLPVIGSAVMQATAWLALLFFIGANATPGGFGTPLGLLLNAVEGAKQMQASLAVPEILIVGSGDAPDVDNFPAVMEALFRGTAHRFVDGNEAAVFPPGGAVALIEPGEFWARGRYEGCAATEACMVLRASEFGIELVGIAPNTTVEAANPFPEPRTLANGVELLGWEAEPAWSVFWRVGYIPPAADYHFFNQAEGAQADGPGYPSRYWRDGDVVISFFDLQASGPVRVGMYQYPSVINVPVMDAAGLPYSDAVTAER